MTRRINTSKNVALNTTIQMTGVLRRHCVNAYNTAAQDIGINTLRRVLATLRQIPQLRTNSAEHRFLSNYAFFAADSVIGKRRVFVRQFHYLVRQNIRALRERIMASPFAAWECVGNESKTRDGFLWQAIGLPDRGEHQHRTPTFSPTRVHILTDTEGLPLSANLGDVRTGWLVNFDDLQIGNSSRIQQDLAGRSALLFSMPVPPQAAARLKKVAARRGWHGEFRPGQPEFIRADYERDILTQTTLPDCTICGLDKYYYLPVRLRESFPERFFSELTRKIATSSGPQNRLWHAQIARACSDEERAQVFAWFDSLRESVEQRVNYYSSDEVELDALRRLASNTDLLAWMNIPPNMEIDLSDFPPLPSQPIEWLDLTAEWLEKTQLKPHIPISRARKSLKDRHNRLQQEFENSVVRHLARMRWVSLIKRRRAREEDHTPTQKHRSPQALKGYTLELPDYNESRQIAYDLFGAVVGQRPIRDVLAPLKGRLSKLEDALRAWRPEDAPQDEELTLDDLPMTRAELGSARGIGPSTVETIESLLLDELLAWPREMGTRGSQAHQAGEQLADGLDELGDLFG